MNKEFFANNRHRLFEKMEEGSVLFLHSGIAPVKSHDQNMHPFAVNRDFYYLTGIEEQDVWLILGKSPMGTPSEALFIEQPDEEIIKWNGKMLTVERACELSGMEQDDIKYKQDMERFVARKLSREADKALFSFDRLSMGAFRTPSEDYALKLREKYPALPIENAFKMISGLRAIKTPEEIECIRKAGDVTIKALEHMLRSAKPGEYEYQWAADFEHYVARSGMGKAFTTIAASGANAVMLHYSDNDHIVNAGDLILFDLGAEYRNYASDVSRTFPVGGKFTERQKELYKIVREAMDISKDKMRPGVSIREPQQAVIDFYKKALRTIGLITDDSEVGKYYYHGVSHSLGLDTHDPSDRLVYEPGMVVSNEPGLYIKEEGIGIRLENDILITEGEPCDLIGNRLLDIDEIENIMNR
ncbi:MAG: aminopeptidase P family protein [Clostridia bacterium]|nr:aminopeptidase P family protein [Clostridia bacterium]